MKKRNYVKSIFNKLSLIYLKFKVYNLNKMISGGNGKIIMNNPFLKVTIILEKDARFILNGNLKIINHIGGEAPVFIYLSENSCLNIKGDFLIGNGVRIYLHKNSKLTIGGKRVESESGITENSKIMVFSSIDIGEDFLCAWNTFISDSDWHTVAKNLVTEDHHKDIVIDDHVWIGPDCNILKGTKIGKNSIIASKTILSNKSYPQNSLIAGAPARIIESEVHWSRDIR
jgi:acetyltransferase-like isoleucine patch superfamily enzyme